MASNPRTESLRLHVGRALAGDAESFAELVRRYQGGVHGLVYHLTGNFTDAQDIVQDVFVTAYTRLDQLRQPERFGSWLRTIAQNECRMAWRGRRDAVPLDSLPPERAPVDVRSGADVDMEQHERWSHVRAVLARLPEPSRLALTLHYLSDWSYADIAEFLDVPVTTVVGRLHRARRLMQGRLEPMVRDTFDAERLEDGHIAAIVAAAIDKAKKAKERWERVNFLAGADEALGMLDATSSDPEVVRSRVEVLGMRGEARATWIGDAPGAVRDYLHAIATADEAGHAEDAARLCKDLVAAYLRGGQYDAGRNAAGNARERFEALGDPTHAALMRAAVDLCDELDGAWAPGEPGGYVMAAFPLRQDEDGLTFGKPVSVRNYTWGRPSPSVALAWLLYPARVLGSDLGAGQEDRITDRTGYNVVWGLPEGHELVACSAVETNSDTVVTPAGSFSDCLRVRTTIAPPDGRVSPEYVARAHGGVRLAWYAPGVGCVKVRHEDQMGGRRTLVLADWAGTESDGYFPADPGAEWRYRWWRPGSHHRDGLSVYEDVVRVVAQAGSVVCLSSATWVAKGAEERFDAYIEEMLACERGSEDDAGVATFLECKIDRLGPADADMRLRLTREVAGIYERLGDEWRVIDARWRLDELDHELSVEEQIRREDEKAAFAGQNDNWHAEACATYMKGLVLRGGGRTSEATPIVAKAGRLFAEGGDLRRACGAVEQTLLYSMHEEAPPSDLRRYSLGQFCLRESDGELCSAGSIYGGDAGFPPGAVGTPLTCFVLHGAFAGAELLTRNVGDTCADTNNTGRPWGTDTTVATSALTRRSGATETPAGAFGDCAVIETVSRLDGGNPTEHADRERIQGYTAYTKRAWFAPGVGVVRVRHEHGNGRVSDMELVSHAGDPGSHLYVPLAVGNRWEYRVVDEATGTVYDRAVQVAA